MIGDDTRPPIWRSVLLATFVGLATLFSTVFSPAGFHAGSSTSAGPFLFVLVALATVVGGPVALFWRHRIPFLIPIISGPLAMIIPIGNTLAFVSLAALWGRRRGPAVLWTTGLVALTSTFVVIADALAQPKSASFFKMAFSSDPNPQAIVNVHPAAVAFVVVIGLGISIGAGALLRTRHEAITAKVAASAERETSDRLGDEAARRQERERIAREVHDAMGHRLSLLNLHAGAMEANADDPRVAESARLVRTSAAAAMEDLRSLLAVLRDPMAAEHADLPLEKLADVVRESFGAGQPLSSSIFIQDPERADPTLSRAVYRIVQELLTNARRHAPDEHFFLTVEGGPERGIVIDSRNLYRNQPTKPAGSSRGLAGITERAELLGGRMQYGLDDGGHTFRVHVELPWRERGLR